MTSHETIAHQKCKHNHNRQFLCFEEGGKLTTIAEQNIQPRKKPASSSTLSMVTELHPFLSEQPSKYVGKVCSIQGPKLRMQATAELLIGIGLQSWHNYGSCLSAATCTACTLLQALLMVALFTSCDPLGVL
mmetsp:Transcript_14908/g.40205  ORF Transcript_14908/g.40205 Transcript_14908/m.40205 type:complete len:132 (+) Transcript_14908:107-502(+)